MLTPVELGLLIQSTIYFTVVSDTDGFKWECDSVAFFQDACYPLVFQGNSTLNDPQPWMVCGQGSIQDFVARQDVGMCGSSRAYATVEEMSPSDCPGYPCYVAYTVDDDGVNHDWCVCSTDSASYGTLNMDPNQPDECPRQFDKTIIALLVLLLAWLLRVFLEGVWNYRRYYFSLQSTAAANGSLKEEDFSNNWEVLNAPWRAPFKIPLGVFDILIAAGLCAIMFVLGVNPYHFCIQPKLYSCVALAALSVVNVVTLIPFIIVLKCIQCRVGSRAELATPSPAVQHQQ